MNDLWSHSSTIVIARFFGYIYGQDDEGGVGQTNTTARSNPMADARPLTLGDLNGLCFPDLERMMGTMPDPNSLNQLMQNPAASQMMQSPPLQPTVHEPDSWG